MKGSLLKLSLPLLALGLLSTACGPASTGGEDGTPTESAPTATGDYRISSFQITSDSSAELDVDGDGKGDNNLDKALEETVDFIVNYVANYISNPAVSASLTAALNQVLNVETLNQSLAEQINDEIWLTRVLPPEGEQITVDYNAWVDLWYGYQDVEDLGTSDYYLYEQFGFLEGTYNDETEEVSARSDSVPMIINIGSGGYYFAFPFELEMAQVYELYDVTTLTDAQLAGAISVEYLEALIAEILDYVESSVPGLDLSEMEAEIADALEDDDVSDITLADGTKAISVNFTFSANAATLTSY